MMTSIEGALPRLAKIDNYEIDSAIGLGRQAITYLARDTTLGGTRVAIKEYFPQAFCERASNGVDVESDPDKLQEFATGASAFHDEGVLLAQVRHPGVVQVLRALWANRTCYLVLEWIEGSTLAEAVESQTWSQQKIGATIQDLVNSLVAAHSKGIFHRDVSPNNVLIRSLNQRPVLIDFGSAGERGGDGRHFVLAGTPGFCPLEQELGLNEQEGPWGDAYSLGALIYFMSSGLVPPRAIDRWLAVKEGNADPLQPLNLVCRHPVSNDMVELVSSLLTLGYRDRPSIDEISQLRTTKRQTGRTGRRSRLVQDGTEFFGLEGEDYDAGDLPEVGHIIKERFRLDAALATGGMGSVFVATDLQRLRAKDKDTEIAIKFLNPELVNNDAAFTSLQREAKHAQALQHPNIINVYDFDSDGDHVFLTMELVRGETLTSVLGRTSRFPVADASKWLGQLLGAVAYAHEQGITHADLKSDNVLISEAGVVKILDFGISRAAECDPALERDGLRGLTRAYAAPALLQGARVTPADDVYALGCVIFELLSGHMPFGPVNALEAARTGQTPARPPGLTRMQWRALRKALELHEGNRFANSVEFLSAWRRPDYLVRAGWVAASTAAAVLFLSLFINDMRSYLIQKSFTADTLEEFGKYLADGSEHLQYGTYVNAARAYLDALRLDPYSSVARDGLARAIPELGTEPDSATKAEILDSLRNEVVADERLKDRLRDRATIVELLEAN